MDQFMQTLESLNVETIVFAMVGIVLLYAIIKLFKWPIKIIINGIAGVILLYLTNFIGGFLGFSIGINAVNAIIAGFLGVPGVIFLIIFQLFM